MCKGFVRLIELKFFLEQTYCGCRPLRDQTCALRKLGFQLLSTKTIEMDQGFSD